MNKKSKPSASTPSLYLHKDDWRFSPVKLANEIHNLLNPKYSIRADQRAQLLRWDKDLQAGLTEDEREILKSSADLTNVSFLSKIRDKVLLLPPGSKAAVLLSPSLGAANPLYQELLEEAGMVGNSISNVGMEIAVTNVDFDKFIENIVNSARLRAIAFENNKEPVFLASVLRDALLYEKIRIVIASNVLIIRA